MALIFEIHDVADAGKNTPMAPTTPKLRPGNHTWPLTRSSIFHKTVAKSEMAESLDFSVGNDKRCGYKLSKIR